jgi:alpha-L-rhamnosidase
MFFPYPSWFSFELPDQTMWWGSHLWQHYLHFGDQQLVADLYPVLLRVNSWFQAHLSARGSLDASWSSDGNRLLWPWIDHGHRFGANMPGQKRGEMAALDALYYKFLTDAANLARAAGRGDDATTFDAQGRTLKDRINANYWDPVAGIYWDDPDHTIRGEQASVLAVLYGIAPADQSQQILNNVMDSDFKVGHSSPHFYFFILDALAKAGLYDRALDTIRRRWGDLLAQGATAWGEMWTTDVDYFGQPFPPGVHHHFSLAHGYSSAPTVFLTRLALGVRPAGPAFSRFLVSPIPGVGLDQAAGAVPSPFGMINVSWARNTQAQTFNLSVTVPQGTVGTVSIPSMPVGEVAAGGVVIWRNGGPVTPSPVPGLRLQNAAVQGRVVMDAQPGTYALVSR